jgi:group I intron endonuclease
MSHNKNVFTLINLKRNSNMGCIYRIVCHATGRNYIGQTSYSHPFVRFREHQNNAKNGDEGPLYEDMRTYALSEFECICLRVALNTQLNDLECYYAEQYNAYVWEGGYNVGECGRSPVRRELSDERRAQIKKNAIWKNLKRS